MKNYNMSILSKSSRRGFTIIELLVAVGVTALLVSLMLTIVVNILGGWSKSSGTLTSGNQARTVMDMITADLQSAIMRRDGNVWLVATIQTTPTGGEWGSSKKPATSSSSSSADSSLYIPTLANNQALEDYRFGQGGMWLRFFSSPPDTNASSATLSAPRAIAYQIVRQSVATGSAEKRYLFFRSELAPNSTFTAGYNLFDTGNYYASGAGSVLRTPTSNDLIANNVIDFGVRFYKRNSTNALVPIFPATGNICFAATSDTAKSGPGGEGSPVRDFPTVAEIFVRILTDDGVAKISNLEENLNNSETWWDIALANSRVYSRRIEIKSTGL